MPSTPSTPSMGPGTRSCRGALGALLALAVVSTAAAPGLIQISRGDTLSGLAQQNGTTVAALQAANGLGSSDRIFAGQTLVLPSSVPASTSATTTERTVVVAPGENVTVIAQRYGTSVNAVLARNGLTATSLVQPGQQLIVPVTVRTVLSASAPTTSSSVATGTVSASAAQHRATLATRPVPSPTAVRALVAATARRYGVDPSFALSVAFQESGFQQRVVSGVDAIGVMQVLPSTGAGLSAQAGRTLDLLRTEDNVTAGVLLLGQLLRSTGSEHGALAGYYQGAGSIERQGLLPQTFAYMASIDALRPRFRNG